MFIFCLGGLVVVDVEMYVLSVSFINENDMVGIFCLVWYNIKM